MPDVVFKPIEKSEIVIKSEIATIARLNVEPIPEISDNELLEMAIQFESKYLQ